MPAARLTKLVDQTHEIPRKRGNGILRREIWVDSKGRVARFDLAFVNLEIHRGDNGRVSGYDNQHGVWRRHCQGEVSSIAGRDFDQIESTFDKEVQGYPKSRRR